jgi:hypothetical protein
LDTINFNTMSLDQTHRSEEPRSLTSGLARSDAHEIQPQEYDELPELTDEMLARAELNKGGQPLRGPA